MDDDKPTNKRPPIDLTVFGRKCRIHRNDKVARFLQDGANLMELRHASTKDDDWGRDGDASPTSASVSTPLRVDRHDARTLLDEMSLLLGTRNGGANIDSGIRGAFSESTSQPLIEEGSEEEVAARNFERYGSLSEYPSCFLKCEESEGQAKEREKPALRKSSLDGDGHADGRAHHAGKNVPDNDEEEMPFELSGEKLRGLPPGIPLNTIIQHTASRIASNNQLEVFIKVKQAANANFSFLNPSDELHRYYLFLKGKPNNNSANENCSAKKEVGDDSTNECNNPLSGLLGGYASSSDESVSPTTNNDSSGASGKEPGGKVEEDESQNKDEGKNIQPQMTEQDKKRKAERLERLRVWKETRVKRSEK